MNALSNVANNNRFFSRLVLFLLVLNSGASLYLFVTRPKKREIRYVDMNVFFREVNKKNAELIEEMLEEQIKEVRGLAAEKNQLEKEEKEKGLDPKKAAKLRKVQKRLAKNEDALNREVSRQREKVIFKAYDQFMKLVKTEIKDSRYQYVFISGVTGLPLFLSNPDEDITLSILEKMDIKSNKKESK